MLGISISFTNVIERNLITIKAAYLQAMQFPPNFSDSDDEDHDSNYDDTTCFPTIESDLTVSYTYSDYDTLGSKTSSSSKVNIPPQFLRDEDTAEGTVPKALNIYHGSKMALQHDVDFKSPVKILTDIISCKCSRKLSTGSICLGQINGADKLLAGNLENSVQFITMLRDDIMSATEFERRKYIEKLISASKSKITSTSNRMMVSYSLRHVDYEDGNGFDVCRNCFCMALGITEANLKTIKAKLKVSEESGVENFSDKDKVSAYTADEVKRTAFANGCQLTRDQENFLIVSRSTSTFLAIAWMEKYFNLVGDVMPNTNGEIHLEACDYADLYEEYAIDMENLYKEDKILSYSSWRKVWKLHFQHVRVREYKQVTGKCDICEIMSEKRKSIKSAWGRQLVTECHAFHR